MKWRKLGKVFAAQGQFPWMLTHAANPVAQWRSGNVFRCYFSSRDANRRAHVGFVDIDLAHPQQVLALSDQPVIAPGPIGAFDDSGTSMGCLVVRGQKRYLYYLGWNLGVTVPWRNAIGLAISDGPDEPFRKLSRAPVMDRCEADPFTISYPWVMVEDDRWLAWYGSNLSWGDGRQEQMDHLLKFAESTDGMNWTRTGEIAVPFQSPDEYAMSKPTVVRDGMLYKMWYSYRGSRYRIGYAESSDARLWVRHDEQAGIEPSADGWDNEAVCYPCVFDHDGQRYLLYNGNGYGATGFGLAVLEKA